MKRTIRDQRWLAQKVARAKVIERFKLYREFDRENHWRLRQRGRAMKDLADAYAAIRQSQELSGLSTRELTKLMAIWLRQNRRIVPSRASFARFLPRISII
jgi:hypothetical protein